MTAQSRGRTESGADGPRRRCVSCGERYGAAVLFCPKDGTPTGPERGSVASDPYLGRVIAGQFRIERVIGMGAMARVYLAQQLGLDRPVALKILHSELAGDEAATARLRREATIGGRLRHPNLAEVLMMGRVDAAASSLVSREQSPATGGEPFIVLEYLDGMSLSSALLASGGALGVLRAVHIALQICDALGEAHALGIVHRDLKPDNIMLVRRGADSDFVKVLDFGMARAGRDPDFATRDGAVLGTARYIAPEGAQGGPVGPEGDVYAIATLLFQCIAGRTPFDGTSAVAILVQQVSAAPPDLRSIGAGREAPPALAELIARNLAKDPLDRAPNARSLGAELTACVCAGRQDTSITARLLGGQPS
ncbi:MAG TPA: serine/threonine-protein kinase [Polyangiaceae bacterium]|nr:serine/threonine-protein kinase [Polyangiaceae bacterium]